MTTGTKTILNEQFAAFIKAVYSDPPAPNSDQWLQLRDAFWAGALVAYTSRDDLSLELEFRSKELKAGLY